MEKEKLNMEKEKNKSSIIVVLVIIICILIAIVAFLFGKFYSNLNNNNIDDVVEKKDGEELNNEESSNDNEVVEEIRELDFTKSINTTSVTYSDVKDNDVGGNYGLSMNINSDKKSITLAIDWSKFGSLSGATAWANETKDYNLIGFSKEIVSTFVGELGQDPSGVTLFFLMNDGTVEYMPMFIKKFDQQNNSYYEMNYTYEYSSDGRITGEHFESKGTIVGVSDVIKLYNVSASSGAGWMTVIGAKKDGSFYDLGNIID